MRTTKKIEEFEPTPRQVGLRQSAADAIAQGRVHPVTWLQYHYEQTGENITAAEFEEWKRTGQFRRWFYGSLVVVPDEDDLRIADSVFHNKMIEGVASGDAKAMQIYATTRGLRKSPTKPEERGNDVDTLLAEFGDLPVTETPGNPWSRAKAGE